MNRDSLDKMEGYIIQRRRRGVYEDYTPFPYPDLKSATSAKKKLAYNSLFPENWRVVKRVIIVTDTEQE